MIMHSLLLKIIRFIDTDKRLVLVKLRYVLAIMVLGLTNPANVIHAQNLEPRTYSNTPIGMNFLLVGYQNSRGGLLFDPSLPITDANADVDMGFLGYVHSLGVAGQSAKVGVLLPYAKMFADGYVADTYRTRKDTGLADPTLLFSMNLYGAPALGLKEYKNYKQDTVIGMTFKLTAPLGEYDADKLINIGTNRWSLQSELGLTKAIGPWSLEVAAAAVFYTDNDDFDDGKTRHQDPIYSMQGHVLYSFKNHIWAAFGATYYAGGRTEVDGVTNNDLQQNWRTGFTVALPIDRHNSIKLFGNSGVSTRTGTDYDSLGIAWQYRWGGR